MYTPALSSASNFAAGKHEARGGGGGGGLRRSMVGSHERRKPWVKQEIQMTRTQPDTRSTHPTRSPLAVCPAPFAFTTKSGVGFSVPTTTQIVL